MQRIKASGGSLSVDTPDEDVDDRADFGKEAKLMFDAIQATGERFGLGMPIAFLAGSVSWKYFGNFKSFLSSYKVTLLLSYKVPFLYLLRS